MISGRQLQRNELTLTVVLKFSVCGLFYTFTESITIFDTSVFTSHKQLCSTLDRLVVVLSGWSTVDTGTPWGQAKLSNVPDMVTHVYCIVYVN